MHPSIFEMIKEVKKRGSQAAFTTNGYLLEKDKQKGVIESALDFLRFSVDHIADNNKEALKNIEELIRLRGHIKKPLITFNITVTKENIFEVPKLIQYGKEIGIDAINLISLVSQFTSDYVQPLTISERKNFFKRYLRLGKQLNIPVGGSGFNAKKKLLFFNFKYKYCPRNVDYVYINQKGDVTPCCWMPTYKIGNIFEQSLNEIWESHRFNVFRTNWRKICGDCNLMK